MKFALLFALLLFGPALKPSGASDDDDKKAGDKGRNARAVLNGFQQVPSILTTGQGEFRAVISEQSISYELTYSNLSMPPVMSHIHFGQSGVNGAVFAFLCGGGNKPACPASGTVTGEIQAADIISLPDQGVGGGNLDDAIRALRSGNAYANVHTARYPNGEIRGQIRAGDN